MENSRQIVVTIFGFGNVGRSIAHLLINLREFQFTINVMDPSPKVHGSLLDLGHATFLTKRHQFVENSRTLLNSSEFIFHSAGGGVPPGGSRLDLSAQNCSLAYTIFRYYQPTVDAKIIVITNPVDNVAFHTQKVTGLDASKVIGTGTLLDSMRMNYYLHQLKPTIKDVNAVLIGEHGASIVVAHSLSTCREKRLFDYFSEEEIQKCLHQTITAASEIKKTQGASIYGVADCAVDIMRQIMHDSGIVYPLGVLIPEILKRKLACNSLYMSIPAKLTKDGVFPLENLCLEEKEFQQLAHSAQVIQAYQ